MPLHGNHSGNHPGLNEMVILPDQKLFMKNLLSCTIYMVIYIIT